MLHLKRRERPASPADERGQSITEFAVLLPVLVLILLGAVDLGRAYFAYVTITNASREGARYGVKDPTQTNGTVLSHVQAEDPALLASATVSVDCAAYASTSFSPSYCSTAHNGDQIRVTVNYKFDFITTYIVSTGQFTLSNATVMAITNGLP